MESVRKRRREIQVWVSDCAARQQGAKKRRRNKVSPESDRKAQEDLGAVSQLDPLPDWKNTMRRKVSGSIRRKTMKQMTDYSLCHDDNFKALGHCKDFSRSLKVVKEVSASTPVADTGTKDKDLQQKIDHEIKMREGTANLLAACKRPTQMLEAAKNLFTSNKRIIGYMSELQKRTTAEFLGKNTSVEGNQLPCKAQVSVSDIRIPLMWKDTDHFKNKGDHRRYAVFCMLKIGTEIYDTSMISNVDRSMTDISFEDVLVFNNVPHDFECMLEVYCHKLHEDLTIASTPKKIRKKINEFSGSVGRNVGKRLSGLSDADIIGNMVLGPKFELVAKGQLHLVDVDDSVRTFDLTLESGTVGTSCELPFFGHYCCRVAAVPLCLIEPAMAGFLNLQEDDDLSKWKHYWCVLKNLQLSCWSSSNDVDVLQPILTIPVTKNTQISDADPRTSQRLHTFHLRTVHSNSISDHSLAADSKEDLDKWWDGFQQHLLDQALWKHACEQLMRISKATPLNLPVFLRKSSLYDETPIKEPDALNDAIVGDLKMDDTQLSQMLHTIMGEAQQIRGDVKKSPTS